MRKFWRRLIMRILVHDANKMGCLVVDGREYVMAIQTMRNMNTYIHTHAHVTTHRKTERSWTRARVKVAQNVRHSVLAVVRGLTRATMVLS